MNYFYFQNKPQIKNQKINLKYQDKKFQFYDLFKFKY